MNTVVMLNKQRFLQSVRKNYRSLLALYWGSPNANVARDLCKRQDVNVHTNHRQFATMTDSPADVKMDGAGGDYKKFTADYDEVLKAQEKGVLIIDVRENNEINETGKLPGSIHIPMGDVTNLLTTLSDEVFKSRFDKPKPSKDTMIIVSCRSGKRSAMVQKEMQKFGYQNVYNYDGGWLDWESRQKA